MGNLKNKTKKIEKGKKEGKQLALTWTSMPS
jgi:hypothetical protein